MNRSREDRLAELLTEMFDAEEFRRHLEACPSTRGLLVELPPPAASFADFLRQTIAALGRRGMIDSDWFGQIAESRPRRVAEIEEIRALWAAEIAADTAVAGGRHGDAKPWRTLSSTPPFLRPEDRQSSGGLRLLDIQPSTTGPLPVLRFTLKNEAAGWLTLTALVLEATCLRPLAVFTMARPVEPAAFWDIEVPEFGGQRTFQADRPIELPAGQATMVELRLFVLRAGRDRVAPGLCGRYTLRFEFRTGEGASASSESIPC